MFYNTSYDFLKNQEGYFIRVRGIKLNRHLGFPLTSKIDEHSGVRDVTNEMGNGIIYIDKVGLEGLVTFHEAGFGITCGYYFNSGRNNKIHNVIKNLHGSRLKSKDDKNPAEVVIKLLMDSMHGKTIIKPVETDTNIKYSRDDLGKDFT